MPNHQPYDNNLEEGRNVHDIRHVVAVLHVKPGLMLFVDLHSNEGGNAGTVLKTAGWLWVTDSAALSPPLE